MTYYYDWPNHQLLITYRVAGSGTDRNVLKDVGVSMNEFIEWVMDNFERPPGFIHDVYIGEEQFDLLLPYYERNGLLLENDA